MKTETLATAFTAALNHIDRSDDRSNDRSGDLTAPPPRAAPTGDLLIDALRHSATDRDQIMLRRIGLMTATIPGANATPA